MVDPARQQASAMPQEAPALTNPPATQEQLQQGEVDRARAALGASPADVRPQRRMTEAERAASGEWQPDIRRATGPVRSSRFQPPAELEFEFTPPETQDIRNNNVPLTIGLLFSIVAAFVVFLVSLSGNTGGDDPILAAFWRGLGALAVMITLSFAASWFMPAPANRRELLERLDAEDRALGRYRAAPTVSTSAIDEELPIDSLDYGDEDSYTSDRGSSVDVTLDDDEELFDNVDEFLVGGAEDDFYNDEDDLVSTSPGSSAIAPSDGAEE